MYGASLEELRDLSRRSRATTKAAFQAILVALVLLPLTLAAIEAWPAWRTAIALAASALGGALLVRYAHVAGQERGAYRRLFRNAKQEALRRVLMPESAEKKVEAGTGRP